MYLAEIEDGQIKQLIVALTADDQKLYLREHPNLVSYNKLPVRFSIPDQEFSEYLEKDLDFPDYMLPDYCEYLTKYVSTSGDIMIAFHYKFINSWKVKILSLNHAIKYLVKTYEPYYDSSDETEDQSRKHLINIFAHLLIHGVCC